jgi:hypothetical protein
MERDAFFAFFVEETELDLFANAREHREVGAVAVPGGAEWIGTPKPDLASGLLQERRNLSDRRAH